MAISAISDAPYGFIVITDFVQFICASIYYRSGHVHPKKVDEGDHQRTKVIKGSLNLEAEVF